MTPLGRLKMKMQANLAKYSDGSPQFSFDPSEPRDKEGEWTKSGEVPIGGKVARKKPASPTEDQIPNGDRIIAGDMVAKRSDFDLKLVPLKGLKTTEEIDTPRIKEAYKTDFESGNPVPPIVVDWKNNVRDGHHRLQAAEEIGLTHIWAMKQREPAGGTSSPLEKMKEKMKENSPESKLSKQAKDDLSYIRDNPGSREGVLDKKAAKELQKAGLIRFDSSSGVNKVYPTSPAPSLPEPISSESSQPTPSESASVPKAEIHSSPTRHDLSEHIADLLSQKGYSARAWHGGNSHRIYIKKDGTDYGHIEIGSDGSLDGNGLKRQRGTIMSELSDAPQAVAEPPRHHHEPEPYKDEDVQQHEEWERRSRGPEPERFG